jgi:hypothetical protein
MTENSMNNPFASPTKAPRARAVTFTPQEKNDVNKYNSDSTKYSLTLIRYHIPSEYKETCHIYEAPYKYDSSGKQLIPLSVLFIKESASISGQSRQNWPASVDGSNC